MGRNRKEILTDFIQESNLNQVGVIIKIKDIGSDFEVTIKNRFNSNIFNFTLRILDNYRISIVDGDVVTEVNESGFGSILLIMLLQKYIIS